MVGRWIFLFKGFLFRGHSLVFGGVILQPCPSRWFKGIPDKSARNNSGLLEIWNEMIMIVTILVRDPDITFTFVLLSILLVWFVSLFTATETRRCFFISWLPFLKKKTCLLKRLFWGGGLTKGCWRVNHQNTRILFGPNLWTSKTHQ